MTTAYVHAKQHSQRHNQTKSQKKMKENISIYKYIDRESQAYVDDTTPFCFLTPYTTSSVEFQRYPN